MEMYYNIILSAFITIFAAGLLIVSLASYRKYKNLKLLCVSLVFLVLLSKGILLSLSFVIKDLAAVFPPSFSSNIFDLLILIFLLIATLKR